MTNRRTVVWIDHVHAVVADVRTGGADVHHVEPHVDTPQLHRKSGPQGSGHAPDDVELFESVARGLQDANEVLIVGPGLAKQAFRRHLARRHPDIDGHVVDMQTVDHPTDAQLIALARAQFRRIDQLRGTP